jgi:hypothetical protein
MKQLALLLLALPLAACASANPPSPLRQAQFAEAKDLCAAHHIKAGASPYYWPCVNAYLSHYRWQAAESPDASLHVIVPRGPNTPAYF